MFNGTCEEAINFYKDCLDGEIGFMGRFGDGPMETPESHKNRVMHADLKFWGGSIFASDVMEEAAFTSNPEGANVHLSLTFDTVEHEESTFNKLKEGGTITMELQDTFWGDHFGMITDKYGMSWMFSHRLEEDQK